MTNALFQSDIKSLKPLNRGKVRAAQVRNWLESIGWNKKPPAPDLPTEVAARTGEKYRDALKRLTGNA